MEMWKKAENGEAVKPPAVSIDGSGVIITRNCHLVLATEDKPAHYEYEEAQMSLESYEMYQYMKQQNDEMQDALIELAELVVG